ncbi:hypothetical protein [Streptomyces sp. SP17KL33]|uniref:hypothetical protein n=1 Tax=Streptomyces sp. SP17KL33 TaxID=3002534 RepID=UPI002E764FA5|nr:hypothetical protein [Streptomyces sp. SP17KL33]MEE1838132.1 hypothetical protein [Streptomyces sp. SP17KL33]
MFPGFNATTSAILDVLQSRMDYSTGHARYVLKDVMERTGLKRAAVTKHIAMVRRAGWLAWVEHGSLRNAIDAVRRQALRALDRPTYARTATVYAATIPPEYDAAVGNVLDGTGYEARVISIASEFRPNPPVDTAGKAPVDNPDNETAWTPSRWVLKGESQVQVVGGEDSSTGQARTVESITPRRKKRKKTVTGYKITGERIERAQQMARSVRPLINWIQGSSHRELSWVFLDLVARGWSENKILIWLNKLGQEIGAARRRPRFPHRVIAAALLRSDKEAAQRAVPKDLEHEEHLPVAAPNPAYQEAREILRSRYSSGPSTSYVSYGAYSEDDQVELDAYELAQQKAAVSAFPDLVLVAAQFSGREEAIRIYGGRAAEILELHDLGIKVPVPADRTA